MSDRASLSDVEILGGLAVAGAIVYLLYKGSSVVSDTTNAAIQAGSNFDTNVGLAPFDAWVSSLFSAPSNASTAP